MSVQKKEKAMWEMLDRFFLRVLGEKEGTAVMAESREQAASFLAGSQETSPSRRALMQSTILPRTAVYTVLKRRGLDAEKLMDKYVREVQGPASHDRYAGLEWIPRFFSVFRWAFRKTTSSSDAWVSTFEEQPEEPVISTYDYEYRTNTEVITAVEVSGGQSDPDDPVTVQFHIDGTTYTVSNVYYPDGDSQLAWVRWTTPDEPQDMTIDVDVSGPGSAQATIHCKIVDLDENPPPNPVADDRNDSFTPSPVPDRPEKTSAQWTIWDPWWQEYWVWHGDDEDGYWCDHGWWEFDLDRYSASLSAAMEITPDEKNPTASDSTMKSGYGVNQVVTARVNSSQRSATTALQNAVSYLPEFNYESFWRLLDRMSISSSSSRLEFQKNEYSTYNRRTHFTPIWYPDGSYTVNTWVIDCWTPAGMLSVNLTDSLNIRGNLWDDWHIAPLDL